MTSPGLPEEPQPKNQQNIKKTHKRKKPEPKKIGIDSDDESMEQSVKKRAKTTTSSETNKRIFPQITFTENGDKLEVVNTEWPSWWNLLKLKYPVEFEEQTAPVGVAHTIMYQPCHACTDFPSLTPS